jgi:hypothetical protein
MVSVGQTSGCRSGDPVPDFYELVDRRDVAQVTVSDECPSASRMMLIGVRSLDPPHKRAADREHASAAPLLRLPARRGRSCRT